MSIQLKINEMIQKHIELTRQSPNMLYIDYISYSTLLADLTISDVNNFDFSNYESFYMGMKIIKRNDWYNYIHVDYVKPDSKTKEGDK